MATEVNSTETNNTGVNNVGRQITIPVPFTRPDGSQGVAHARVSPDISSETIAALGRMAALAEQQLFSKAVAVAAARDANWQKGDPKR